MHTIHILNAKLSLALRRDLRLSTNARSPDKAEDTQLMKNPGLSVYRWETGRFDVLLQDQETPLTLSCEAMAIWAGASPVIATAAAIARAIQFLNATARDAARRRDLRSD
jgi:hypothetical protein